MNLCPEAKTNLQLVEADLLKPDTWKSALSGGIEEVYHVASPLPMGAPDNDDDVIKPAVEGTLNVLEACRSSGTVRKVVITSSCSAIWNKNPKQPGILTSEDWGDVKVGGAYDKSKILAEQAAWEYMNNLSNDEKFEVCVLNPGFIMGPLLYRSDCTSATLIASLLHRDFPVLAKVKMFSVDVRDLATMHINAMKDPHTSGKRHICVTNQQWYRDMAKSMSDTYKPMGYNIPTTQLPNFLIKAFACLDKTTKIALPYIGIDLKLDQADARRILNSEPIPFEKTLNDMCNSLVEFGIVKKTNKYRPQ